MTLQILPTKLFKPPPRPTLVPRPHLLERLNKGRLGKLTLVSAPAGYGKSTLLSEWVHQVDFPSAWLSLDSRDNDPIVFWTHFIVALQSISLFEGTWIGEGPKTMIQSGPPQINNIFFLDLITDIATITDPFVVVLDDLHLVTDNAILDKLYYLIENLPDGMSGMHLVISSRRDPPWPLARLRVKDHISEIRARDLRFTRDETTQFLNQTMGLDIPPRAVNQLEKRTEGWAAGLQMAALALSGATNQEEQRNISRFLEGFTGGHHFILDYLMEEVLRWQAPDHLDFLLKTSILERLNGPLCAAVTGNGASLEILLQLEKSNMFLVALDDQRNWYRYHYLFADMLTKQLQIREPEIVLNLHHRASIWYDKAGFETEAVAHAIKTKNWKFAANQIERHILDLIQRGNLSLTRLWINALPDEAISPSPVLCLARAWTSTRYATVDLAEDQLIQAETLLAEDPFQDGKLDPDAIRFLSSQIAILGVVIARAKGESTQRQQDLALEAIYQVEHLGDTAARATLLFRLGLCYLDLGKNEQADRTFSQAVELGRSSGNNYAIHGASYGRMIIARLKGNLYEVAAICRQNLENRVEGDPQQPMIGIDLTMMGMLHYEWDNLDQAQEYLSQGLELIEVVGITELLIKGHYTHACLQIAQRRMDTPPDLVGIARGNSPAMISYAGALSARLDLLLAQQNDDHQYLADACRWAENQALAIGKQSSYDWEVLNKLVVARVLCLEYRIHQNREGKTKLLEVLDFLKELRQPLEKLGWFGLLIELDIVLALLLQTLGVEQEALTALERALSLAENKGFVRTFIDEGDLVLDLFQKTFTHGRFKEYGRKLIGTFNRQIKSPQEKPDKINGEIIDQLSERELQVLRMLKSHLSVPEIADEIHLAPTTVRTHVQNIYRKLDVHGRMEALHKAERLGIL